MNWILLYTSNGQHTRCHPPGKEFDKSIKSLKYIYSLTLKKISEDGGEGGEKQSLSIEGSLQCDLEHKLGKQIFLNTG